MKPRWDGSRVLFEIDHAGQSVLCAISRSALQELGGKRAYAGPDLVKAFLAAEPQIAAIAANLFDARPDSASGIISIWSDDITESPEPPAIAGRPEQRAGALVEPQTPKAE
jgi:hypothetical protein